MKAAAISRAAKSLRKDTAEKPTITGPTGNGSSHPAYPSADTRRIHLTHREREVLSLLCEGLPNKLIARRLKIASGTVKVHISKILRALNVSNRLQAVLLERCWELVSEPVDGDALLTRHLHRARHR